MAGASFEAMLELRARSLRKAEARMRPPFPKERTARSAAAPLAGLVGPKRREAGCPPRRAARLGRGPGRDAVAAVPRHETVHGVPVQRRRRDAGPAGRLAGGAQGRSPRRGPTPSTRPGPFAKPVRQERSPTQSSTARSHRQGFSKGPRATGAIRGRLRPPTDHVRRRVDDLG